MPQGHGVDVSHTPPPISGFIFITRCLFCCLAQCLRHMFRSLQLLLSSNSLELIRIAKHYSHILPVSLSVRLSVSKYPSSVYHNTSVGLRRQCHHHHHHIFRFATSLSVHAVIFPASTSSSVTVSCLFLGHNLILVLLLAGRVCRL